MSPDPSQEQLVELAKALLDRTRSGTAKWRGDSTLTSFSVVTRKGSVVIGPRDDDGQPPYNLSVLNAEGQAIQWLASEWWPVDVRANPLALSPTEPAPWNEVLEDLYRLARASAVDLEGVIGGILEEVDHPPPAVSDDFPAAAADDDIPF